VRLPGISVPRSEQLPVDPGLSQPDGIAFLNAETGGFDVTSDTVLVNSSTNDIQAIIAAEGAAVPFIYPARLNGALTGEEVIIWSFSFTGDSELDPGTDPAFWSDGIHAAISTINGTYPPGQATVSAEVDGVLTNSIVLTITQTGGG